MTLEMETAPNPMEKRAKQESKPRLLINEGGRTMQILDVTGKEISLEALAPRVNLTAEHNLRL